MTDSNFIPSPDEREEDRQSPEVAGRPSIPEPPQVHFEPPPLRRSKPPPEAKTMRTIGLAATIGAMLVAPVVVGIFIGMWLDQRFHTAPTWTVLFLLLGIVAGFVQMIRILQRIEQEEKRR